MYRDLNESNLDKSYSIKSIYPGSSTCMVDYGNGERKYLIHEDEKGFYIRDGKLKRWFSDRMNELLKHNNVVAINEATEIEILKLR